MVNMDSLVHNFGKYNTGGRKAIQRPRNSEPKRSKQVSIEKNTVDTEKCVYSSESRRSERNVSPM